MTDALTLRPFSAALEVLKSYDAEIPEPLVQARDAIRSARILSREFAPAPVASYAGKALDAADVRKGIEAAAKRRAVDLARAEIAAALYPSAISRAVIALNAHADEVADAVLSSPALAEAFEEIERLAPRVSPSMVLNPDPEHHGLDAVANVARLRQAASLPLSAYARLVSVGALSDYGPKAGHMLYADPTDADPIALDRAVRGLRPGAPDVTVWTRPISSAVAVSTSPTEPGVPAAILAATPGVTLSLATSARELARRISLLP